MATLTYAQLEGLWITNGGNKAVAPLAAAIAMAESSGRTDVTSANPDGGVNVGLWQLDTKGKGAGHTVADLQNPATNAAVAVQGSNDGTDWSAWETFATGAYKRFMSAGTTPDLAVPGGGQAAVSAAQNQAASAGPDCAFSIGGQHIGILFGHGPTLPSACLVSKTEVRAILGGLIMVAGGLVMMPGLVIVMAYGFKATGAAATAAKVAPYLGPYGKAVGVAAKGAGRGAQVGGRVAGRGAGAAGRGVGRGAGAAGRAAGNRASRRAENAAPVVTDPAAGV
jgi:Lysozyme like domain